MTTHKINSGNLRGYRPSLSGVFFFFGGGGEYTKENIASESTLLKTCVDTNFNTIVQNIRDNVASNKIWISIDETADAVGRLVANVVIGTLQPEQQSKEYLLTSEVVEKSNSSTIAQLFTNSLAVLWPEGA